MYLIPIVYRQLSPGLHQCWLLLERNGTHAMEGTPETAATFAAENGLEAGAPIPMPALQVILLPIKATPALADFYTWAEVTPGQQPMCEVWRPFLWSPAAGLGAGLDISIGNGLTVVATLDAFFLNTQTQA